MSWRKMLCSRLSAETAELITRLDNTQAFGLEELRFRLGRRTELVIAGCSTWGGRELDRNAMNELISALSGYALYSCEGEMSQGYISLPGGHRAGVCGKMTYMENGTWRMRDVTSVCLRIARHIPDCDQKIRHYYFNAENMYNLLFLGPPGCGKTTVLRSCALFLSSEAGRRVCVVDEREEFFGGLDISPRYRIDVLSGLGKAKAMNMLLRSMSPQVIVVDEIGDPNDAQAVRDAARCGVAVFASAHAASLEEACLRPTLNSLIRDGVFDRYVLLGRKGMQTAVLDRDGRAIE